MDVYKLELYYCADNVSATIVYDTEESAIFSAIDHIIDQISHFKIVSSLTEEEINLYNEIVNYIKNGLYENAISSYNDFPDECSGYEDSHVYINVDKCEVVSYPAIRYTIPPIISDDEDDKSSEVELSFLPAVKEQPCVHCAKMNDVGVDECWYCGNKPE